MASVSPMLGLTSSTGMPKTSANCWAIAVREPPMSTEPSTRLTLPLSRTLATAQAGPVLFRQNPMLQPLPRSLPSARSSGSDMCGCSRTASIVSSAPMRPFITPSARLSPCRATFSSRNSTESMPSASAISSMSVSAQYMTMGAPGAR